jgi:hypothetical protein
MLLSTRFRPLKSGHFQWSAYGVVALAVPAATLMRAIATIAIMMATNTFSGGVIGAMVMTRTFIQRVLTDADPSGAPPKRCVQCSLER